MFVDHDSFLEKRVDMSINRCKVAEETPFLLELLKLCFSKQFSVVPYIAGRDPKNAELTREAGGDDTEKGAQRSEESTVFTSLPLAINWLRDSVRKNQSVRFQVIQYYVKY